MNLTKNLKSFWRKLRLYKIADIFYLVVLGIYLLKAQMGITMYHLTWPEYTDDVLFYLTVAASLCRFIFHVGKKKYYNLFTTMIAVLSASAMLMSYWHVEYDFLRFLAAFMFGAVGLDYKKVFKVYIASFSLAFGLALLGSATGAVVNLTYSYTRLNGITHMRAAEGICYPTDCAAILLFVLLAIWVCYSKISDLLISALALFAALFSYEVCNAQNSTLLLVLLAICAIFSFVITKIKRNKHGNSRLHTNIFFRMIGLIPIFAAFITYVMNASYGAFPGNLLLEKLNNMVSSRLLLGSRAIQKYGIHLLGTAFKLVGAGGSTSNALNYNFVDCGYLLILLRYGLVVLIVVLLGQKYICDKSIREGQYRVTLCVLIITAHNIFEHHGIELHYNIFLLLPYCMLRRSWKPEQESIKSSILNVTSSNQVFIKITLILKKIIRLLLLSVPTLVIIFNFSWIISAIKTVVSIYGLNKSGSSRLIFIAIVLILVVAVSLLTHVISLWMKGDSKYTYKDMIYAFVIIFALALCLSGSLESVSTDNTVYTQAVEDKDCIDVLKRSVPNAKIYSYNSPLLYRKLYNYTNLTWLPTEDLSRFENISVIIDKTKDLPVFFDRGFFYCEISDSHALYTNDKQVIEALRLNGYLVYTYFSYEKKISLSYLAALNSLPSNENGALIIPKNRVGIIRGPFENLTQDSYVVIYRIKVNKSKLKNVDGDRKICTIYVSAYKGNRILKRINILCKDIPSDGKLTIAVPFYSVSYPNIEFKLINNGVCNIKLSKLTYRKYLSHLYKNGVAVPGN